MLKNLLVSTFLAFSSSASLVNKAPLNEPQRQNENFTTFETETYFNNAFGDLTGYQLGIANNISQDNLYGVDYDGEPFIYYAFPIFYDLDVIEPGLLIYYSNDYFNFVTNDLEAEELFLFYVLNYTGGEATLSFGRLNSLAMAEYMYNEQSQHLTGGIISSITQWVTGFMSVVVAGLSSFVAVFYTGEKLTAIGTLALMGLGIGLVTLAIAFVTKLFKR